MPKGYRTYIINGILAVAGVIVMIWPSAEVPTAEQAGLLVDNLEGLILLGTGIVNGILRSITTTPPGQSE